MSDYTSIIPILANAHITAVQAVWPVAVVAVLVATLIWALIEVRS